MAKEIKPPVSATPNYERWIIKDNALVMASYKLSVEEQRLILASIGKANDLKKTLTNDVISVTVTVNDYAELYNVKMKTAYEALSLSAERLWERTIRIREKDKERKIRWLQEQAIYDSGKVQLTFSSLVSSHLRSLVSDKSTQYRLEQATQLRTQHSIRLFEVFQMLLDKKTREAVWEVSVVELKKILDIEDNYERWIDFKKKILDVSMKQLNTNTSLKVDWEVSGKEGKKITHLRFHAFEENQLTLPI